MQGAIIYTVYFTMVWLKTQTNMEVVVSVPVFSVAAWLRMVNDMKTTWATSWCGAHLNVCN